MSPFLSRFKSRHGSRHNDYEDDDYDSDTGDQGDFREQPPPQDAAATEDERGFYERGLEAGTETSSLLRRGMRKGRRYGGRLWGGFTDFAFQGNILELAVGFILANAFTTLVTSFVSSILLPPLSFIFPLDKNMDEKFAVLRPGPNWNHTLPAPAPTDTLNADMILRMLLNSLQGNDSSSHTYGDGSDGGADESPITTKNATWVTGYTTLTRARDDGAVVMAYGEFFNKFLNFLGMGVALYGLAVVYEMVSKEDIIKRTVECQYCGKRVAGKARRCVNCTSWLDGREEKIAASMGLGMGMTDGGEGGGSTGSVGAGGVGMVERGSTRSRA